MAGRDAREAIALAEGAVTRRLLLAVDGVEPPTHNALGQPVVVGRGQDVHGLLRDAEKAASGGERVALVAGARALAAARHELARIASRRLPLVVHCVEPAEGETDRHDESAAASAMSLSELPWATLVAVGAGESLDLALVARRAAEDSGCPFLVVHERSGRTKPEVLVAPGRELVESFLGEAAPGAPEGDAHAIAERVPFALASALREMEALSVRRLDVLERAPATEASLALVGVGAVGDSMLADVERLRADGHDVMAIRLLAWRPFPGPRLVRALGRAVAVTVIDAVERPLAAGGGPLAVELKAAFSDALTWAPGYPGIGRIPRISAGSWASGRELSRADVTSLIENMHADERGTRRVALTRRVGT